MYTEINYNKMQSWNSWLDMYFKRAMFWYCWETKCYMEIRSTTLLRELYEDEDYNDGIFTVDKHVF